MGNFFLIICVSILFAFIQSVLGDQVLKSPQITNWGDWGTFEKCPAGTFVKGFQVKSETWIGPFLDDTCMNGLKFYCGDIINEQTITSSVGSWGKWRNTYTCANGANVVGFQLRVETGSILDPDETATNNIRIICSNHGPGEFIEADGEGFGKWTDERRCAENEAVCGLQTQIQPDKGLLLDDTALNNIGVQCCDLPAKEESKSKNLK